MAISDSAYNCWRECSMAALAGFLVFYLVLRLLMFTGLEDWDAHEFAVVVMIVWDLCLIAWRLHVHGYLTKVMDLVED